MGRVHGKRVRDSFPSECLSLHINWFCIYMSPSTLDMFIMEKKVAVQMQQNGACILRLARLMVDIVLYFILLLFQ